MVYFYYYRDITVSKIKKKISLNRCHTCCQLLENPDLKLYEGHPGGAVEEYVALTDPRLSLFSGEEDMIHEHDERPQNKITHFRYVSLPELLCDIYFFTFYLVIY